MGLPGPRDGLWHAHHDERGDDFNLLTGLPWVRAYWAEGPRFVALGLSDTDPVSTLPDEIGSADMTQATADNRPVYNASGAASGRPSIKFDGSNDSLVNDHADEAQPTSEVAIYELVDGTVQCMVGDHVNGFNVAAGVLTINAGSHVSSGVSATSGTVYVHAGYFNGASSRVWVNGTTTTGDVGALARVASVAGSTGIGTTPSDLFLHFKGSLAVGLNFFTEPAWRRWVAYVNQHYGTTIAV